MQRLLDLEQDEIKIRAEADDLMFRAEALLKEADVIAVMLTAGRLKLSGVPMAAPVKVVVEPVRPSLPEATTQTPPANGRSGIRAEIKDAMKDGKPYTLAAVAKMTGKDKDRVASEMANMAKAGALKRIDVGTYRLLPPNPQKGQVVRLRKSGGTIG